MNKIDRYIIKDEIGRGGMSIVYRAFDPQFEREVAIKILPKEFLHDPQYRKRFEREAKTMGALEHFSIVPLYDLGEIEGQPYLVFRYMQGGTLADLLRKGPLSIQQAANVVSRIASALDAAHARGIIHRDLKPSNILLDQYGGVFLSDFGIVRMTQTTYTTLTGSAIIGSPPYMSPEQIQGESEIDARSDIYSLGVILFEMLAGKPPFPADNPTQAIMAHLLEPIPNILEYRQDLPAACQTVIEKVLAKNKEERYATAGEFAISLQAALFGEINGVPLYLPGDTIQHKKRGFTLHKKFSFPFFLAFGSLIALILVLLVFSFSLQDSNRKSNDQTTHNGKNTVGLHEVATSPILPSTATLQASPFIFVSPVVTNAIENNNNTSSSLKSKVIGGSDLIALLASNEILIFNLDGNLIKQITNDKKIKSGIQWMEDGKKIKYLSGNCVYSINIDTLEKKKVFCLSDEEILNFFEISSDNKYSALGINNKLYIVPYKPSVLPNVKYRSDLLNLSNCNAFTPYNINYLTVNEVIWSSTEDYELAAIVKGLGKASSKEINTIQIFKLEGCSSKLPIIDQFPIALTEEYKILEERYRIDEDNSRYISLRDISWSTDNKFAFVGQKMNNGYGDLFIYHYKSGRMEAKINPIDGACCYRAPKWSANGKYLSFFFLDEREGASAKPQLFFIPYSTFGIGLKYKPLSFNPNVIINPLENQHLELRKANSHFQ